MKKNQLIVLIFLLAAISIRAQVVTTASSVAICTGPATVQIPVKVSAFNAVGSISLKFSYNNSEITSPTIVYTDPGIVAWGTFQTHLSTPGTIIISAFDPDIVPPVTGLTLTNNTIIFTLQFTIGTITTPAQLNFVENSQGNSCEYGGIGPDYTPFADTPQNVYYIDGSVTIVADPVAPGLTKNPADASVCAGVTLTVSTSGGSGGTGTIADEYSFSTNNGTDWSAWSASVPSFAAVAGTNKIRSRRTATGTACDESAPNEVSWVVNAKQKISGTFNYYKLGGNVLLDDSDITVELYKTSDASHTTLIASDVTDASGYYEFAAICPDCDYDIVATSTHSTEGAVNTTDAAQANYWGPNPYSIEKVRFHAGDVEGLDRFIGGIDAGRIQMNFVNGAAFDKENWVFWTAGNSILHNPIVTEPEYTEDYAKVTLSVGIDFDADMYGLATGDYNRSFNPGITKAASSTLSLVYSGTLHPDAGESFELPVRMVNEATIGAVSLVFSFPEEMVEITDIRINDNTGNLKWAVKGDELRISWHSPVPLELSAGDELVTLMMKSTPAFTSGNTIRLELAPDPLNELADAMYDVIGDAIISVESIAAATLGIGNDADDATIGFSCYPNPSHDFTLFRYSLPYEGFVKLEISSLPGCLVASPVNGHQEAGDHLVKLNTTSLPNGIYTATLTLNSKDNASTRTIKLIINK